MRITALATLGIAAFGFFFAVWGMQPASDPQLITIFIASVLVVLGGLLSGRKGGSRTKDPLD